MKKEKVFIAVAGNIGSGKSSLTKLLSEHFGWKAYYESVDDNPYLDDFYKDMKRWSSIYKFTSSQKGLKTIWKLLTRLIQ